MSKRQVKSHASSSRAAASAFGGGFGSFSSFGSSASQLSYVSEPPDLSSISDANTVVLFKNLSKKDSTTKAKALEDLQTHITSPSGVEDAVLEAWVRFSAAVCTYDRVVIEFCNRAGPIVPSHVDRQRSKSPPACTYSPRPDCVGMWKENCQIHAQNCGRMARWII